MSFLKQWSLLRVLLLSTLLGQVSLVSAEGVVLSAVDFNALSGDNLQLSFEMTGKVAKPKVFHTDNPARIVLDFEGVKSGLKQKRNVINAGGINSFFAVESGDRLRVVINLLKLVAYDVKLKDNRVIVTLNSSGRMARDSHKKLTEKTLTQFASLIPEQSINKIDFRRGAKGEGRLLIYLSNPNTVVNTQEKSGKIVLSFLNTSLPAMYAKKMDVLDFATPVSMIEAKKLGSRVKVIITPAKADYAYSSFQEDGVLILEVRPITTAEQEEKRKNKFPYTGERLSLNFQDIEIRSVLQILADFTDLNILASDSVGGNLTLRLNDVPWDQALDFVMKSKGLSKRQAGNVILVAPTAEIRKLEEEEIESQKVAKRLEPLKTEYIQINYAKANNFRNIILGNSSRSANGCTVTAGGSGSRSGLNGGSGSNSLGANSRGNNNSSSGGGGNSNSNGGGNYSLLSDRGTAIVDSRTNTLIIKDTAKNIEEISKMILKLDRQVRQVLIEARIVIAQEGFAQELGVKFGAAYTGGDIGVGGTTGGNDGGVGDIVGPVLTNLAASNPYGALGMTLSDGANYILNLEVTALQDKNKAEFVSNPKVLTSDRCKAIIKQGTQIPYKTVSQNGTSVQFKDAQIILEVTPQITPSGSVIMQLKINKDAPGSFQNDGQLSIDTRSVETSVRIENGETVVLGGVFEGESRNLISTVPWFSDLPLVGWMFRKTVDSTSKKELLIFITPKIVKDSMRMR
ncbi:type IV pilus secretin family protein [methanotrophic endosymbiont of Bathymodiolus puteoserpentis (Logatchev)]|jgi:type IV pilus assembly protein PilQ|uniref:type IV pilus secretin family protein n=1 Tax=methanotrophic endosymbiont of Bathymodiolus puteoserpentis (Logatchev) TaxID=343235 RepID=UPI0013C91333|nr:type IV pilus secretin family protein [methanotrophic endosymbiont of Bathymodiolus puteoserpentis (Logatchev)]SHE20320.1 Type IV pilus biogenesis protein PilQ [methanotrophic endosymbiont of Bathymodiolus puteoserpentis (Logatchev)]